MVVAFSAAERQSEKGRPGTEKCAGGVLSRIAAARGSRDAVASPAAAESRRVDWRGTSVLTAVERQHEMGGLGTEKVAGGVLSRIGSPGIRKSVSSEPEMVIAFSAAERQSETRRAGH